MSATWWRRDIGRENFTRTGRQVRERSPFAHTLVSGDTNGMFGYIGDDAEIDRGGYETESFWMVMYNDGFRLPRGQSAEPCGDSTRCFMA